MSKNVRKKAHLEVYKDDKDKFIELAAQEQRTLLVMFGLLVNDAIKKVKKDD